MFLGGQNSSLPRPFGKDVVLDGIDLDIEAGRPTGYVSFIRALREWMDSDTTRSYLISAAPQCPIPDVYLHPAIVNAPIDRLFVQFYNNYCGVDSDQYFNIKAWLALAESNMVRPDAKIYLGVPADKSAAKTGYVPVERLSEITSGIVNGNEAKHFGGIMLWEVSQAERNSLPSGESFARAVANFLHALPTRQ
jgi:chitinase